MKVLFISRLYPTKNDPRNGAVMHKQAKELVKNGAEVRVIAPIPFTPKIVKKLKKNWREFHSLPKITSFEGITVYHPRYIKIPFGFFSTTSSKFIVKSTKKLIDRVYKDFPFEIIHTHMGYPDNFSGIPPRKKYNVPLITTIRSSDMDITIKKRALKKKLEKSLSCSDQIIAPSGQLASKLKKIYNYNSVHIGNGINPKEVYSNLEKNDKLFNNDESKKVLSISNLTKSKGIQYNIKAIAKLSEKFPDIHYTIIGEGPYKKKLLKLVNELDLNRNITFLGALSHKESMKHLNLCDVFSMPSWRETFGLVYLEAMFLKKPVILCENQGLDGSVTHNKNALTVKAHSVDSIVIHLENLFNNNIYKEKIANNGYELVIGKYTWKTIGEDLYSLYQSVLSKNNI